MMPCRLKISGITDGFSTLSERNHQIPANLPDWDEGWPSVLGDNSIGRDMVTWPSWMECKDTLGGSSKSAMLLPI